MACCGILNTDYVAGLKIQQISLLPKYIKFISMGFFNMQLHM
jgi:hypothetical protein